MRLLIIALLITILTGCVSTTESSSMFTASDFSHLKFLEGRWEGTGPDGKPFYEEYSFPSSTEMRSSRYADNTFSTVQDGSVVALHEGRVTSTWNEFTWQASELTDGKACFVPISAPSSFCWERVSINSVQVTQRWTDQNGQAQQYVVPLQRL